MQGEQLISPDHNCCTEQIFNPNTNLEFLDGELDFDQHEGGLPEIDVHTNHDHPVVVHNLHAYVHELKQYNGIAPCNNTLTKFVLQDFSETTCSLKVHVCTLRIYTKMAL